jgi:hypothetical protein
MKKALMEQSSQNGKNTGAKLPKKWAYAIGLAIVFGVEFVLRDFLLPENADNVSIGLALVGEWVALSFLVFEWVPKVEKKNMERMGSSRLHSGSRRFFYQQSCSGVRWIPLATLTSANDKRIRLCHSLWPILDWDFLGRGVLQRIPH